ncbi:MAG: DUF4012 domain-containing protein [Minisyncoccia bacterium]
MELVPYKNVDLILADIKKPGESFTNKNKVVNLSKAAEAVVLYRHKNFHWSFLILIIAIVIGFSGVAGIASFYGIKNIVLNNAKAVGDNFKGSIIDLQAGNIDQSIQKLNNNEVLIKNIQDTINQSILKQGLGSILNITPIFSNSLQTINYLEKINSTLLNLNKNLENLKLNGFDYFKNNGSLLIANLQNTENNIQQLIIEANVIQKNLNVMKQHLPLANSYFTDLTSKYIAYLPLLYQSKDVLQNLISFLSQSNNHILFAFQNPSEIRPGGGFIGSYADVVVSNGQLQNIDVRDIYDPDGQLSLRIIPPVPLQTITTAWGARDANWFFDFPLSAKKILYFINHSKMYTKDNISFNNVIAVNLHVVEKLLDVIGPINLPEYGVTVDSSNFANIVQKEVEAGQDKKTGYPKRILKVLTPILISKLESLDENEKKQIVNVLLNEIKNKDIMFYFDDPTIENFLINQQAAGAVYVLPDNFWGNYLAVVNANINGGKSDAYIKQNIQLNISIDTKGNSFNDLIVTRQHNGLNAKDYWYRLVNKDYLQVFTNSTASFVSIKGVSKSPSNYQNVDYKILGYSNDPDVYSFESNNIFNSNYNIWQGKMFNKNVFGGWVMTSPGNTSEFDLRYQVNALPNTVLTNGKTYQFIYEKQSGVDTSLKVEIDAPIGYIWKEVNSPIFIYSVDSVPSRLIINLTLQSNANQQY